MREIKFRAWSLDYNWMEDNFFICSNGVIYGEPSRYFDTPNVEVEENPNLIVMQYTGLKDKNGVEIYEGDIISDDLIGICQVKYNDTHAAFKVIHKNNRDAKWFIDYLEFEFKYIKVIGNIYENPELLEN